MTSLFSSSRSLGEEEMPRKPKSLEQMTGKRNIRNRKRDQGDVGLILLLLRRRRRTRTHCDAERSASDARSRAAAAAPPTLKCDLRLRRRRCRCCCRDILQSGHRSRSVGRSVGPRTRTCLGCLIAVIGPVPSPHCTAHAPPPPPLLSLETRPSFPFFSLAGEQAARLPPRNGVGLRECCAQRGSWGGVILHVGSFIARRGEIQARKADSGDTRITPPLVSPLSLPLRTAQRNEGKDNARAIRQVCSKLKFFVSIRKFHST